MFYYYKGRCLFLFWCYVSILSVLVDVDFFWLVKFHDLGVNIIERHSAPLLTKHCPNIAKMGHLICVHTVQMVICAHLAN